MSESGAKPALDAAVSAALDEFVNAWLLGRTPDVDAFCRERPECGRELRERIEGFLFVSAELRGGSEAPPAETSSTPEFEAASPTLRALGDFRIVREIGRGGMGVVYEAEQISLRRRVALKVLAAHRTLRPEQVERFQREAAAAARLRHPGIVPVFAVGEEGGTHYFAMELVDGESLDDALRGWREHGESGEREHIERACRIVAAVADALDHAHRAGVIHRDVKPSNVLMRRDGSAVLTDFGLAREEGLPSITLTGELAGTPYYIAPEQAIGRRGTVDARSDVFSLGVTLYELLTLRRPFEGESAQEVLAKVVTKEPPSPQRVNPRLATDLATIVLKAIEKEPRRRYATAADFAADLRAFLEFRPIAARRTPATTRVIRWARREPFRAALAAVVVLALGGALFAAGWFGPRIREANRAARVERAEDLLGQGYMALGEHRGETALREFEKALVENPDLPEAVAGRALAFLLMKKPDEALAISSAPAADAHLAAALRRLRVDALAMLDRRDESAKLEAALGEPSSELEHFVEAMRLARHTTVSDRATQQRVLDHVLRAVLLSPRPRAAFDFQLAQAAKYAGDKKLGLFAADAIERHWPDSPRAWNWIAHALGDIDPKRSLAAGERATALDPNDVSLVANLAGSYAVKGEWRHGVELAKRAVAMNPRSPLAQLTLGMCFLIGQQWTDSIEPFRRCIELDPKIFDAHHHLAMALLAKGDLEGTVAEAKRALELDRFATKTYLMLGHTEHDLGRHTDAASTYRAFADAEPTNATALHLLGAELVESGGDLADAERALARAVELSPRSAAFRSDLASVLSKRGELSRAIDERRRTVELDPTSAELWSKFGALLDLAGEPSEAVEAHRRAVELAPADATIHEALLRSLHATDDEDGARVEDARFRERRARG